MNKADRQESDRRVLQVSEWLLDGESTYKIVQYCSEKWQIGDRQVRKYIERAKEKWNEIYAQDFENNLKWHLIARRKLFNSCIKEKDRANARQILNDMADIQGLRELRIKSEHTETHEYRLIVENAFDELTEDNQKMFLDLLRNGSNGRNKKVEPVR